MNDKMRKASQLVIGGALCLSLVTGCAKVPDSTPAISQPAATEPSATTKATKPAATTKPTATKPTATTKPAATKPAATTKATTAPAESKATEPSATTTATQPPETKPAATTAPTQAPTQAPTAAPTTAPTEAPTTAPTEAPTEATTAPTEAPQISLDYDAAMAAGNAYGVSTYGWIYDPSLGWDDGFDFASWYSLEEIAEGGGQSFLNTIMQWNVDSTAWGRDGVYGFNCYCYESNGFVYFYVFYG